MMAAGGVHRSGGTSTRHPRRFACSLVKIATVGVCVAAAAGLPGCGSRTAAVAKGTRAADAPILVPWHRIGDIALGESRSRVESEYGVLPATGYYRLHGTRVRVLFDSGHVSEISFSTPYYRTKQGFGVGSRIPLGPCHKTAHDPCEHLWNGFIYNGWSKGAPCHCWVKVGTGPRSLEPSTANFMKPWFFINTRDGRVSSFYFALKFVD
jgi:hypothetical protein